MSGTTHPSRFDCINAFYYAVFSILLLLIHAFYLGLETSLHAPIKQQVKI
jgi:hypothetical protein